MIERDANFYVWGILFYTKWTGAGTGYHFIFLEFFGRARNTALLKPVNSWYGAFFRNSV